jgi:cytochrome b subunit of formate dehydrogenase/nitrate/TMAO reductase-like tetraheme cytochrome c subunit
MYMANSDPANAGRALGLALLLFAASAYGQGMHCAACHDDVHITSTAHPDLACADCHTNVKPDHRRKGVEPLTDKESCGQCHGTIERTVGRSVHKGKARCVDCHGAPHEIRKVDELESAMSPINQPKNCGKCHNDPPDLIEGYLTSQHGKALLLSGLNAAPACSDCHGTHRILDVHDKRAPMSHEHSPEMCGTCHSILLDRWKNHSTHGQIWQEGSEDGPVCITCHSSHAIEDPTRGQTRLKFPETCGGCHEKYITTFRDSFHGQATSLGFVTGAICSDCHTPHENLPAADPDSSVNPAHLAATCGQCHDKVTASFIQFNPHSDPTNPHGNKAVYFIWLFMMILLIGVFGFFGLHDILWLQRSVIGKLRGEFNSATYEDPRYIRRFSKVNMGVHAVVIVTFLLLAMTGLPLKFHEAPWAQTVVNLFGGVEVARVVHRIAAIGTFGYALFHLSQLFFRGFILGEKGMLWGPHSLVPQPKDIKDLWAYLKYFLYLGPRPLGDRWTYWEKFDYMAVFWGIMIIGGSGLMLWFPSFWTSFLPGWVLNAAHVVHSDEALLAVGFIFMFHFFHAPLRIETLPMDLVMFTGKMPIERFMEERPLEYKRLVESGELDKFIVEAPTARERRNAYIFGAIGLTTGLILAIVIIWTLLS